MNNSAARTAGVSFRHVRPRPRPLTYYELSVCLSECITVLSSPTDQWETILKMEAPSTFSPANHKACMFMQATPATTDVQMICKVSQLSPLISTPRGHNNSVVFIQANKYLHNAAFVCPRCTIALISFHCSSWRNCRTNVQREGCSFEDILVQVYQNPAWRQLIYYGASQRYTDVIASLNHMCRNIEPGIIHSVSTLYIRVESRINCIIFHLSVYTLSLS